MSNRHASVVDSSTSAALISWIQLNRDCNPDHASGPMPAGRPGLLLLTGSVITVVVLLRLISDMRKTPARRFVRLCLIRFHTGVLWSRESNGQSIRFRYSMHALRGGSVQGDTDGHMIRDGLLYSTPGRRHPGHVD